MASNSDYEILLNKYNIAIAKAQDLQEQLQTKQKQWEKRDADFSVVEKVSLRKRQKKWYLAEIIPGVQYRLLSL